MVEKNNNPAVAYGMALLLPRLEKGTMNLKEAENILHENHACSLMTLFRAKVLTHDVDYKIVMTWDFWEKERAKRLKQAQIKALNQQINELRNKIKKIEAEG